MRNFLIVCLIAVLGGGVLAACPIRSRVVVSTPVVHHAVKKVVVADVATVIPVAVFQPLAIAVPTYTAAYTPPVATAPVAPQQAAGGGEFKAILDALKNLDARLNRLEKGGAVPSPAQKPAPEPIPAKGTGKVTGLSVLIAKCASCHEKAVAGTKGSSIVLLEGSALAKLSDKTARKVLSVTYKGTMPPKDKGTLTDEEVSAIVDLIDK